MAGDICIKNTKHMGNEDKNRSKSLKYMTNSKNRTIIKNVLKKIMNQRNLKGCNMCEDDILQLKK